MSDDVNPQTSTCRHCKQKIDRRHGDWWWASDPTTRRPETCYSALNQKHAPKGVR